MQDHSFDADLQQKTLKVGQAKSPRCGEIDIHIWMKDFETPSPINGSAGMEVQMS